MNHKLHLKNYNHLVDLIKLANDIQSDIWKFIFQKRKKYGKQLLYGRILQPSKEITLYCKETKKFLTCIE